MKSWLGTSIIIIIILTQNIFAIITNSNRYFSPNLDGSKDVISIPIIIEEEDLIWWGLYILKKKVNTYKKVKTFESFNVKEQNVNFEIFFSRIIERDAKLVPPPFIEWDGTDQIGNQMEDGVYYFSIEALDRSGNKSRSVFVPIILDTISPKATLKLEDDIFSPNFDEEKETLDFNISLEKFSKLDQWKVIIKNDSDELIRTFNNSSYRSSQLDFKWDGLNQDNLSSPEGFYKISIETRDLAGNTYKSDNETFELKRLYEKVNIELSSKIFSPNDDGFYDDTTFQMSLNNKKGLLGWKIEIYDKKGQIVRTITNQKFRKIVVFDGYDQEKMLLPNGVYAGKSYFYFRSGNKPTSDSVEVEIDNLKPKIKLDLENNVFNPQAKSGGHTVVTIKQTIEADSKDLFQAVIMNESGEIVWQTNFVSIPGEKVIWNGINNEGKVIPGHYVYNLTGEDMVGNLTSVNSEGFKIITGEIKAELSVSNNSLSPNQDGVYDEVFFNHKLNRNYSSNLENGVIKIYNAKKKLVKSFSFEKTIPFVSWDGTDNKNKLLPDGIYTYKADLKFNTKEKISTTLKKIYLDTNPIKFKILTGSEVFSPNDDGVLDQLAITNLYKKSKIKPELDRFIIRFINTNGLIYQEHEWEGNAPTVIMWRGQDQLKNKSPEGVYIYEVTTIDHAFNRKVYRSKEIKLIRTIETIDLKLSEYFLSSHNKANIRSTTITPLLSKEKELKQIDYSLVNVKGDVIPIISKSTSEKFLFSFDEIRLKKKSLANSKLNKERILNFDKIINLSSGFYGIQAKTKFISGNHPESKVQKIYIDNDAPLVQVHSRPDLFSPDQDGINEILDIRIKAKDNYKLKNVNAYIFRKAEIYDNKLFKQNFENYINNQLPLKIWSFQADEQKFDQYFKWNGESELGNLVESATRYVIFVKAEDQIGITTIISNEFLVDILVEKLGDGKLRIILNNINFKYNSDKMLGSYRETLNLLIKMLAKFPNYKVLIEGHTDSRGGLEYNQRLSLLRAKKVYNYLVLNKISEKRLSFSGSGETKLKVKPEIIENLNMSKKELNKLIEENYRINRRVEFYLKKPE